jgi:hypothetical protein
MICPVCLSPDATARAEPLQVHVDCRSCGGPFILTDDAAREVAELTPEERDRVSTCLAQEADARLFAWSFICSCLE